MCPPGLLLAPWLCHTVSRVNPIPFSWQPSVSQDSSAGLTPEGTPAQRAAVLAFLNEIGLRTTEVASLADTFLPGVRICKGGLLVAPNAAIDSILHEAGHLAITPQPYRSWLDGDVGKGQRRMLREVSQLELDPDAPLMRAVLQTSDPEATAWAWAAGTHLGLPPEIIILDSSYDGDGASIRIQLQHNAYIGINGMCHAGMCSRGRLALHRGETPYPHLHSWLQAAAGPSPSSRLASRRSVRV